MNSQMDSINAVRELARGELSVNARLGYVALLLVSAGMTVVILSLWLTEPALPLRTHAAFGLMSVIGVSWILLATWALATRRVLYARDRLIAGRMAVTFTSIFTLGAIAAVFVTGSAASYGAFATGAVMVAMAVAVLHRARQRVAVLMARRSELERAGLGR